MRGRALGVALALGVGALGGGCVVRGRTRATVIYTDAPPPPPRAVVVTARPGWVWVDGSWAWNGAAYVWGDGSWVAHRADAVYVQGAWVRAGHRWMWRPGRWRGHGRVKVRGHGHRPHGDRDHR